MLLNCGVGEDSWESLELQGDQTSPSQRKAVLNVYWKDWCWSFNNLATWCEELTHWKIPWCWERLKAGGEGDDRGWDGWMALPTQWTWVWAGSGSSWWWIGRPGVLQSVGLQRVRHDWAIELNWTQLFSRLTLCDPTDCRTPGFPVFHHLPEFGQTLVHWVSDALQPSHLLSSPSPPADNLPSIRVFTNELAVHIRWPNYWSFSVRTNPFNEYSGLISLGLTILISLQSKGLSRASSNVTVQKHQFFGV